MKLDAQKRHDFNMGNDFKDTAALAKGILSGIGERKGASFHERQTAGHLAVSAHDILGTILMNKDQLSKKAARTALKHFEKSREISKQINYPVGISNAETKIAKVECRMNKNANNGTAVSKTKQLEKCRQMYKETLARDGEEALSTLQVGLFFAGSHHVPYCEIEAERLLLKLFETSNRVHGPDHQTTKDIQRGLQMQKKRFVFMNMKGHSIYFQLMRYEDGGKECTVRGPLIGRDSAEDKTWQLPAEAVRPILGTPVICEGLVGAKHLNGKVGDVRCYDWETDRYMLHFEDGDIKPCLIKAKNIRVAFELP
ncbi:hypothetical protein ACHAWF_013986 [Thalassiosira exigua]